MVLHDVIRDFALSRLGPAGQGGAHAALISAARPVTGPGVAPGALPHNGEGRGTAWWRLPETPGCGYLWEYLTYHLQAAGLGAELDEVCGDLRFLAVRLRRSGPAAVEADLGPLGLAYRRAAAAPSRAERSPAGPGQACGCRDHDLHQQARRYPRACQPAARAAVRPARLDSLAVLAATGSAFRRADPRPHRPRGPGGGGGDRAGRHLAGHRRRRRDGADLGPRTAPPRATLTGHSAGWTAVAIAPTAPGWPPPAATGRCGSGTRPPAPPRATLTGHTDRVNGGGDRAGRHLAGHRRRRRDGADLGCGRQHRRQSPDRPPVTGWVAVAIPDGSWLATGGGDGTVRIWDADRQPRATLTGHHGAVAAVAIAPDGSWLATAGGDGTVRIWDAATSSRRATLTGARRRGGRGGDRAGRQLAGHRRHDGTVRIWAADGDQPRHPHRPPRGAAVAFAPDGTWLATGGGDGTVRIGTRPRHPRATLTGHQRRGDGGGDRPGRHRRPPAATTAARIWAVGGAAERYSDRGRQ